jgi:hypothetical protein
MGVDQLYNYCGSFGRDVANNYMRALVEPTAETVMLI